MSTLVSVGGDGGLARGYLVRELSFRRSNLSHAGQFPLVSQALLHSNTL